MCLVALIVLFVLLRRHPYGYSPWYGSYDYPYNRGYAPYGPYTPGYNASSYSGPVYNGYVWNGTAWQPAYPGTNPQGYANQQQYGRPQPPTGV